MQDKILVTFKQDKALTPRYSFSVLAEIDWTRQEVLRTVKFPTASYRDSNAFMTSILCGVCTLNQRIFVAMWNAIIEIDYETFEIVDTFSHPFMTDLHGLCTDGTYLYVTSTAIDAVLCFDVQSFELIWRWGPDEPILYKERLSAEIEKNKWSKIPIIGDRIHHRIVNQQKFVQQEYRYRHKSRTGYHNHHINDVHIDDDKLYITTKQWNNTQAGTIIVMDTRTKETDFFVPPDSVQGLHDTVFTDSRLYATESGSNGVVWIDREDKKITHHTLDVAPYFVRGLCKWGDNFLVGFSSLRQTPNPAQIIEYNAEFSTVVKQMDVSHIFPQPDHTAIHTIIPSPDER